MCGKMSSKTVNFGVLMLIAVQIHFSAGDLQQLINDAEDPENKYDANNIDNESGANAAYRNACMSYPCGPNAECTSNGDEYTCKCLPEMLNRPPNCRAECSIDLHCPDETLCINHHCKDPCAIGICGTDAECRVINHKPLCECPENYDGDPYIECNMNGLDANNQTIDFMPCDPNPCIGIKNTMCIEQNGMGTCVCLTNFYGDPDKDAGCMPKCTEHTDCPPNRACIQQECSDPCENVCPENADCLITPSRVPICACKSGYTGDAYRNCTKIEPKLPEMIDACQRSPCGAHGQCHLVKGGMAACSCLPGYSGTPPNCMPDDSCEDSDECDTNEACYEDKCINPCEMDICGVNAFCTVVNHSPVCSCAAGYTGNPFKGCKPIPSSSFAHPCLRSPCGPHSECRVDEQNNDYSCHCLPNFIGTPPNCRPECVSNDDCPSHTACSGQFCKNPCADEICGANAMCHVRMHTPICECPRNYTGDPFVECIHMQMIAPLSYLPNIAYECTADDDCSANKTCMDNECINPCNITHCGAQAECHVFDRNPICSCRAGYTGDPNRACHPMPLPMLNASIEFIAWFRTETTMVIMWRSDDPMNSTFSEYKVTIQPSNAAQSVVYLEREREPTKFVEASFSGLIPGRNYNISVQTKLDDRLSMPVIVSYHTVPLRPMNLTLDTNSLATNRFRVMWLTPHNFTEFDEYEVMIQSESGSLEYVQQQRVMRRSDGYVNEFTTETSLQPGQTYQVSVKTVSGKAKSWPETIYVTTRPLPVKDLQSSIDMENGRVMIWWHPNERSRQNEYKINYSTVGRGGLGQLSSPTVATATTTTTTAGAAAAALGSGIMNRLTMKTNQTAYIFESLLPIRNYSVSVQAISNNVESIESTIYVLTPPSVEWYF